MAMPRGGRGRAPPFDGRARRLDAYPEPVPVVHPQACRYPAMSTAPPARADGGAHIGYSLSTEEHRPEDLVRFAMMAEAAGFEYGSISDHFHPWIDAQGNSPFAWTVLGAIANATDKLKVGTGVTCPTMRYHPAIVAQAAATVASLMPGRFFLGLGTGE